MKEWRRTTIEGVISQIKTGSTPSTTRSEFFGGAVPWFTPSDVGVSRLLDASTRSLSQIAIDEGQAPLFGAGVLLVTCIGDIGRVGVLQRPASANQQITALKFCGDVDIDFAYYWFIQNRQRVERLASQAVVPILNNARLKELSFSYPPLPEQKRLAVILAKADRLRRLRRYALSVLDTYLQTVFLEMFGDPLINPKKWAISNLGTEIERLTGGWSPVCEETASNGNQWAVLKLGAVTTGRFLPEQNKVLPSGLAPRPELEVKSGDVLITRKNTFELVAACAFVQRTTPKLMLPDTIFRFEFRKSSMLEPAYLWALFSDKNFRKSVQSLAGGSAGSMPNISKEKFMGVTLPVPPLPLQKKFAQIVQKHERLRAQQQEAARQAERLFEALLTKAFSGELSADAVV